MKIMSVDKTSLQFIAVMSLTLWMIALYRLKTFFLYFVICATLQDINKIIKGERYNERRHILYRKEITLYDSFRLLTPVGIQDSYFGRLYTVQLIQAYNKQKKIMYPNG